MSPFVLHCVAARARPPRSVTLDRAPPQFFVSIRRSEMSATRTRFAAACLVLVMLPSFVQAQSLGEIAKKTQEQREKAKADTQKGADGKDAKATPAPSPAKTYTNGDLKNTEPPSSTPASAATSEAAPEAKAKASGVVPSDKPGDPSKDVVKDEAYWRSRWTPLSVKLGDELNKAVTLTTRIYDLTVELSGIGPVNARRAGVEAERQRLITESQTLDDAIRADKAALAAIQEEGRRAGALPGWFR